MQAPDDFKLFDYAWAVIGGLVGLVWNMLTNRITEQRSQLEKQIEASHNALHKRIDEANDEADTQRNHIAKLFDKLEQHSKDSFTRHIELMNAISNKVDK
jgi:uncharacterized membrane-anchored protein YhcB (DUF1043 family)